MMGNVLEKNMFPVTVQQKIDNYQKQAHKICQCKKTILKFWNQNMNRLIAFTAYNA